LLATVTEIFPDFASALATCGDGYADADIAEVIAHKAAQPLNPQAILPEQAINSLVAVGLAAAETAARPLAILDFGGGCGFHYFHVAAATRVPLRWAIVETPVMAARSARVAQGRFEAHTALGEAARSLGAMHLVHASSALQYVPDPLATLAELAALQAPHFLLARFPLWHRPTLIGVQTSPLSANGIGPMPPGIADRPIRYPVTFVPMSDVMRTFEAHGYGISSAMASPSSNYEVAGGGVPGVTLLLRLRG
jgi:putative methyltransferase (TIGR04325 family)